MPEDLIVGIGIIILLCLLAALNKNYKDLPIPPKGFPKPDLKPQKQVVVLITMPVELARAERKDLN